MDETTAFPVPSGVGATEYYNSLVVEGWIFTSLYCEKEEGSVIKCKTVVLPPDTTVAALIFDLESDSWSILYFTMKNT